MGKPFQALILCIITWALANSCSPKTTEARTSIAFDFKAYSNRRGGQSISIGGDDYCYFVHAQGPGIGVYENLENDPNCSADRNPQGKGILSNMVGRYDSEGNDSFIQMNVPAGSNRSFHLIRVLKGEIEDLLGASTDCVGSMRFGADGVGYPEIYFKPQGQASEYDISASYIEVIGYGKSSINAGTSNTIGLDPVFFDDDETILGDAYACGDSPGFIDLREPKIHLVMRPQVSSNSVALTPGSRALRIDMAPPGWGESNPAAPEFVAYKIEMDTSTNGTSPGCAGSSATTISALSGGVAGIKSQIISTGLNAGTEYELRVCAVYESYGQTYISYGNVMNFEMLKDCTAYAETDGQLNTALGNSGTQVTCLGTSYSYNSVVNFSMNTSGDHYVYGVPNLTTLANWFDTGSPPVYGSRGLPMFAMTGSTGAYFSGYQAGSQISFANIDVSLTDVSTGGNYGFLYLDTDGLTSYIENVVGQHFVNGGSGTDKGVITVEDDASIGRIGNTKWSTQSSSSSTPIHLLRSQLAASGTYIGEITHSKFSTSGGHSASKAILLTANNDIALIAFSEIESNDGTALKVDGNSASIGVIAHSTFKSAQKSALVMNGINLISTIRDSVFEAHGDSAPAINLQGPFTPGSAPVITSFLASKIITKGSGAHGIYFDSAGEIGNLSDVDFVRIKGSVENNTSYAIVFSDPGTAGRIVNSSNLRMCSDLSGTGSSTHWTTQAFTSSLGGRSSVVNELGGSFTLPANYNGSESEGAGTVDVADLIQRGSSGSPLVPEECDFD